MYACKKSKAVKATCGELDGNETPANLLRLILPLYINIVFNAGSFTAYSWAAPQVWPVLPLLVLLASLLANPMKIFLRYN